jgi:hypothetical protein
MSRSDSSNSDTAARDDFLPPPSHVRTASRHAPVQPQHVVRTSPVVGSRQLLQQQQSVSSRAYEEQLAWRAANEQLILGEERKQQQVRRNLIVFVRDSLSGKTASFSIRCATASIWFVRTLRPCKDLHVSKESIRRCDFWNRPTH